MTLKELTNQESGIILYGDTSVAVVNWANMNENEFPEFFAGEMVGWPNEPGWEDGCEAEVVDNFCAVLPGTIWSTGERDEKGRMLMDTDMDIVYDANGDLLSVFCGGDYSDLSARVFRLADGKVIIAPNAWN